ERLAVGVVAQGAADLGGQLRDPADDRLECGDEREHDRPSSFRLKRLGAAFGGVLDAGEQFARGTAATVAVTREEASEALLAEPASIRGCRVTLDERERDRAVDVGEHAGSGGPEALQLGAQLVSERDPMSDE